MEWLAGIWKIINKPVHLLLAGVALVRFAPTELAWAGYFFVSLGVAGTIEWGFKKICYFIALQKKKAVFKRVILSLNTQEKEILLRQLRKGEQTFYLNWSHYHGIEPPLGDGDNYRDLVGIYRGLEFKEILTITTDDTVATLHIPESAWDFLRKAYGEES